MQVVYELPNESQSIVSYLPRRLANGPGSEFFDENNDSMSGLSRKSRKSSSNNSKKKMKKSTPMQLDADSRDLV